MSVSLIFRPVLLGAGQGSAVFVLLESLGEMKILRPKSKSLSEGRSRNPEVDKFSRSFLYSMRTTACSGNEGAVTGDCLCSLQFPGQGNQILWQ